MIYDYFCLDCGNRFSGAEISFDLSELTGLRGLDGKGAEMSIMTHISAEYLIELANKSHQELRHGQVSEIEISLKTFIQIMGENADREEEKKGRHLNLRERMGKYSYSELGEAINEVFDNGENEAASAQMSDSYKTQLTSKFVFDGDVDSDDSETDEDLDRYHLTFWIKPEFLDEGKSTSLYTVQYKYDKDAPVFNRIMCPAEIRGYCPSCGKPVLKETGKVQHALIGMLGVQSAGKTSSMIAMMEELEKSCRKLKIRRPDNPLCDSHYKLRTRNQALYRKGWAVDKTQIWETPFNASLLIEAETGKKKIVSFVDIPGEQCFDLDTGEMNRAALTVSPLIRCCDIYLLCTCIDQTAYGNENEEEVFIPPRAVTQIPRNIYFDILEDTERKPPLCILVTKADMVKKARPADNSENPFEKIPPRSKNYQYEEQVKNLSDTYTSYGNDYNIRTPLEWCLDVYEEFKQTTYLSIFSVSALGRVAERVSAEKRIDEIPVWKNENGTAVPFERRRMDQLWQWILQVLGLIGLGENCNNPFRLVPSYTEKYISNSSNEGTKAMYYVDSEALARCNAIYQVFMNPSNDDRRVIRANIKESGWFSKSPERKLEEVLSSLRPK